MLLDIEDFGRGSRTSPEQYSVVVDNVVRRLVRQWLRRDHSWSPVLHHRYSPDSTFGRKVAGREEPYSKSHATGPAAAEKGKQMDSSETESNLQAVLFDLDDTLYDHLHSARHGLKKMSDRHPVMQTIAFTELEQRYSEILEDIHTQLLRNEITQREARVTRTQKLFGSFDLKLDDEAAFAEYKQFREDYDAVCRVVEGGRELLQRLTQAKLRLAIITNNMVVEQIAKLKRLGIDDCFEVVSISEAIGVAKPAAKIFEVTLERLSLTVDQVVMVGDSLTSDIAGAMRVGMRSVWLKRHPAMPIAAPSGVATIVQDFSDVDACYTKIVKA